MSAAPTRLIALWTLSLCAVACAERIEERPTSLGPADGRELAPADTGRVRVGDLAPDFSLASYDDGVLTLSDYRGTKEVILVFYRGWW